MGRLKPCNPELVGLSRLAACTGRTGFDVSLSGLRVKILRLPLHPSWRKMNIGLFRSTLLLGTRDCTTRTKSARSLHGLRAFNSFMTMHPKEECSRTMRTPSPDPKLIQPQ